MKRSLIMLAAIISLAGRVGAAEAPDWKLGVQAWTFNKLTFCEAVDNTAKLGLKYIEAYPGQTVGGGIDGKMGPDLDAAARQKILAKLQASGVKLVNFGVTGANGEDGWKKLFEFAKAMGIETIVSEPGEDQFDILDKLTQEYGINISIHDHPEPSHYWHPDTVLKVINGRNKRIGACADLGHWVRSGLDPVACLQKLEGHVISLHVKDLSKRAKDGHDVPWGTGISNMQAMLTELKRQGFAGVFSIEYEHYTPELMDNCGKCVAFFNKLVPLSYTEMRTLGMTEDITKVHSHTPTGEAAKWPAPGGS